MRRVWFQTTPLVQITDHKETQMRTKLTFSPGRLSHTYPSQTAPQDIFAEIESNGTITISYNPEIGNAVPMRVHHGLTRRLTFKRRITKADGRQWYAANKADLEILVCGMDSEWNGNNTVGTLTPAAKESLDRLEYSAFDWA